MMSALEFGIWFSLDTWLLWHQQMTSGNYDIISYYVTHGNDDINKWWHQHLVKHLVWVNVERRPVSQIPSFASFTNPVLRFIDFASRCPLKRIDPETLPPNLPPIALRSIVFSLPEGPSIARNLARVDNSRYAMQYSPLHMISFLA